jgi:hypothetical protein
MHQTLPGVGMSSCLCRFWHCCMGRCTNDSNNMETQQSTMTTNLFNSLIFAVVAMFIDLLWELLDFDT